MLMGEKIILRPLELRDAKVLYNLVNDWEVRRFLPRFQPFSELDEEQFIRNAWDRANKGTDLIFGIVEPENRELIGTIGLHKIDWKNRNAELGISIWRKDYWGKGYGSDSIKTLLKYAFCELNLHRVFLRVYDFNERAIHVYEKLGFRKEGVLREDLWRDGKWHNTIIMSILEREFESDC